MIASDTDLAWFCGFFDGEGSVAYVRRGRGSPTDVLRCLQVTNTHLPTLEHIVATFGGAVYVQRRVGRPQHRPVWRWQIGGSAAVNLARIMLPYSREKRGQLEAFVIADTAPIEERPLLTEYIKWAKRPVFAHPTVPQEES